MRTLCAVLILGAGTLAVSNVAAQRLGHAFATLPDPFVQPATVNSAAVFGHPDDYRWEGLLIGGASVGVLGAVVVLAFCGDPDAGSGARCGLQPLVGLLFGATIGGVTGGLLGGLIPKGSPSP